MYAAVSSDLAPPEAEEALLAAGAVETLEGEAPLLLLCEHAGKAVPAPWRDLGLAPALLDTHYGWDPGAAALTRALAARLDSPAVLARYSRLFLDYNRFPGAWDCLRPDLGGVPVPGNLRVDAAERARRERIVRAPLDAAIGQRLPARRALVSIHSFTPLLNGQPRPVEIGVLWRRDRRLAEPLLAALRRAGSHAIGDNAPYDWHAAEAYSLQQHALDRGLPCVYLEVRNDLLLAPDGLEPLTELLAAALTEALAALPAAVDSFS